jgi:hypothetical protein
LAIVCLTSSPSFSHFGQRIDDNDNDDDDDCA